MIGLDRLKDGAYTLPHPDGPVWLLVRAGRIVRAEQWLAETDTRLVWPSDQVELWALSVRLLPSDLREGVMPAG